MINFFSIPSLSFLRETWSNIPYPSTLFHHFTQIVLTYWYIFLPIFFFWPIVLSLILALGSLSSWLFWLFTSLLFGIIQLGYVIYQFLFITLDIMGLSVLKTYTMMRSRILNFPLISGLWEERRQGKQKKKRRRREWRKRLQEAKCFKDFTEIPIEELVVKEEENEEVVPKEEEYVPLTPIPNSRKSTGNIKGFKSTSKKKKSSNESKMRRITSCVNLQSSPQRSSSGNMVPLSPPSIQKKELHHSNSDINLHHSISDINLNENHQQESSSNTQPTNIKHMESILGMQGPMLITTTSRLYEARMQAIADKDEASLKFLLAGIVKRNHLSVDDMLVKDARSIAESGRCSLSQEARNVIESFMDEVDACLNWLADSPVHNNKGNNNSQEEEQAEEISDRISLMTNIQRNTGASALMLSGGGAQAMYHLGTIRALVETGLYDDITVISGTSGGSIAAAMCGIKKSEELLRDVCVPNVSTDYLHTGRMKRENIRWFPTIWEMGTYWLKHGLLVDSKEFKKCCDSYYGDITFEESYARTRKHICITVSASRNSTGGGGAQRLLLNHISTPHVTMSSAVAASCALPGVMKPAKLMAKNKDGEQVVFEVDGVEWIDGSVQADLPFKRISTLFNVSNFIVCQVNFHVVPFLNKAHHPTTQSLYWQLFQTLEWDIRSRALNLSRLGLFPRMFGQDISKVFKQKYHGNITLVPRFTKMQLFGMKALVNPTVEDMEIYLQNGQMAAWPYADAMKHTLRLEKTIDSALRRLNDRYQPTTTNNKFTPIKNQTQPTVITTSSARREMELLNKVVKTLEMENSTLRNKVRSLECALGIPKTRISVPSE